MRQLLRWVHIGLLLLLGAACGREAVVMPSPSASPRAVPTALPTSRATPSPLRVLIAAVDVCPAGVPHVRSGREFVTATGGLPNGDELRVTVIRITDSKGSQTTTVELERTGKADGDAVPIVWSIDPTSAPSDHFLFPPHFGEISFTASLTDPATKTVKRLRASWTSGRANAVQQRYLVTSGAIAEYVADVHMEGAWGSESISSGKGLASIQVHGEPPPPGPQPEPSSTPTPLC